MNLSYTLVGFWVHGNLSGILLLVSGRNDGMQCNCMSLKAVSQSLPSKTHTVYNYINQSINQFTLYYVTTLVLTCKDIHCILLMNSSHLQTAGKLFASVCS
jgi:hypothetical protein